MKDLHDRNPFALGTVNQSLLPLNVSGNLFFSIVRSMPKRFLNIDNQQGCAVGGHFVLLVNLYKNTIIPTIQAERLTSDKDGTDHANR
jgi:hypothetical protein